MKHIKPISEFLSEAISMKMYKENLPKELWYDKSEGYKNWDKIFGIGVNRISIPLKSDSIKLPTSTPLMEQINSILIPLGYKINSFSDYLNNKVYKIGDTKNPMKIGGLLSKSNPNLFKKYDTSIERKEWKDKINNSDKELKIIISRHPYDILGMSSGRDWRSSSCRVLGSKDDKVYMDILCSMGDKNPKDEITAFTDTTKKDIIKKELYSGLLVCYVVNINDDNINRPLSRLLIKPYVNKDTIDTIWVASDFIYGKNVEGFKSSVDEWLSSWQGEYYGNFYMKDGIYRDSNGNRDLNLKDEGYLNIYKPKYKWTDKEKEEFLNKVVDGDWELNPDGEVDVKGSVYIWGVNITNNYGDIIIHKVHIDEIPVQFGKVSGNFSIYDIDKFKTLNGCPRFVGGNFSVSRCYTLTSLEKCPISVKGNFEISNTYITSLKYSPNFVGGDFSCNSNYLTSLEFAPKEVGGNFRCSYNQLTSLKFAPTSVGDRGYFDCSNNQLTSLKFAPTSVGDSFYCSNNQLTSLEFSPLEVSGRFDCSNNQLTSLKFAPKEVGGDFICVNLKSEYRFKKTDVKKFSKVYGEIIVK